MKRLLTACVFVLVSACAMPALLAQSAQGTTTIVLKTGTSVATSQLRRDGANVMASVQIGSGTGELGYPVSGILRIDFPEPAQLKLAEDLLGRGKQIEAVSQLEPVLKWQEPFRDIPGNWWQRAAQLKLNALLAAGRDAEAEALVGQIARSSTDPEVVSTAKVLQAAGWSRKGQYDKALAAYDEVIKQSTKRDTLALASLNKGHTLLALRQFEPAILAYLRIPVFYSNNKLLMPPALLGAARAMAGIQDYPNAQAKLNQLLTDFPASPEAAQAKAELEKIKNK